MNRLILAMGVPDHMQLRQLKADQAPAELPGNSGLVTALLPFLKHRGIDVDLRLLGRKGPLDAKGAQGLLNLVCDAGVQRKSLARIAEWEATGLPVVHSAAQVAACARDALPQSLGKLPGLVVPNCSEYPGGKDLDAHLKAQGHRLPVLLRPPGLHSSKELTRVDQAKALPKACERRYVTNFVDSRGEDGWYRKRRVIWAGGKLYARHQLASPDWNVIGDARRHMVDAPKLIEEERAFLASNPDAEPQGPQANIKAAFQHLGLQFGVCDYACLPNGKALIFELNPCFQLTGSLPQKSRLDWRYLEANNGEILAALLAGIGRQIAARAGTRGN